MSQTFSHPPLAHYMVPVGIIAGLGVVAFGLYKLSPEKVSLAALYANRIQTQTRVILAIIVMLESFIPVFGSARCGSYSKPLLANQLPWPASFFPDNATGCGLCNTPALGGPNIFVCDSVPGMTMPPTYEHFTDTDDLIRHKSQLLTTYAQGNPWMTDKYYDGISDSGNYIFASDLLATGAALLLVSMIVEGIVTFFTSILLVHWCFENKTMVEQLSADFEKKEEDLLAPAINDIWMSAESMKSNPLMLVLLFIMPRNIIPAVYSQKAVRISAHRQKGPSFPLRTILITIPSLIGSWIITIATGTPFFQIVTTLTSLKTCFDIGTAWYDYNVEGQDFDGNNPALSTELEHR